ncbi:MAG TPA: DHA2 family efflux MFS transporter permease subunit [Steroidobacteraceae bacterium]|nr:DHA2 family efflux MFS transporter permease subunit [Steroidobacteraceae bacterium]
MNTAAPRGGIPWLIAPVVALAAFMEIMDISIANVALPHIAGSLSSSQNESTWVLTSYLVTNAIIMPISGWLANTFGRKRLFLVCIAGFTATSFLCGLAPNLASLIVMRALQGATGGGLQPVGQAILTDSFPVEKRGMANAVYGIAAVVAPVIGPTLGGWITDNYEWRWIFLINVPVGVALVLLVQSLIKERGAAARAPRRSVDWAGFGFVALALGCLQVVLDRGQDADWFASGLITALIIASALGFVLLTWRELNHSDPMVDLKLMRDPGFAVTFVMMLMLGFMLFGSTFLIPAFAQQLMGYRAVDAGMVLSPGGIITIVLMPLVGRAINKVDLRLLAGIGFAVGGFSLVLMTQLYLGASFQTLMWLRVLQGASLPFLFLPINQMAFRDIPPEKTNNASALINLARNFGGSIGIAFASTLLTRRAQFHQSRLVEQLQGLNPAYPDFTHQVGGALGASPDAATTLASIYQGAVQQATLLSYLDAFKVLGILFLAMIPLLLLVRAGKGGGSPAPAH